MDRLLPLGLLTFLALAAIGLTTYLMSWGGGSLDEAFVPIPQSTPAAGAAAGKKVRCTLDSMNGNKHEDRRFQVPPAPVSIRGWLVDSRNWTRPHPALLRLDATTGAATFEFDTGEPVRRGDVANYFKVARVDMAGFETTVDLSQVPPGIYDISHVFPPSGEKCTQGLSVEVRR